MKIRALVYVLSLGMPALVTGGCDTSPGGVALSTGPSSSGASAMVQPNPIRLSPLFGTRCGLGSPFGTSFDLLVRAGAHDLTPDSLTLHLIDGSNVGGPSVTIPSVDFAPQFGSSLIPAGTTRTFGLQIGFGCFTGRPRFMRGNLFLFDRLGSRHTFTLESTIE